MACFRTFLGLRIWHLGPLIRVQLQVQHISCAALWVCLYENKIPIWSYMYLFHPLVVDHVRYYLPIIWGTLFSDTSIRLACPWMPLVKVLIALLLNQVLSLVRQVEAGCYPSFESTPPKIWVAKWLPIFLVGGFNEFVFKRIWDILGQWPLTFQGVFVGIPGNSCNYANWVR